MSAVAAQKRALAEGLLAAFAPPSGEAAWAAEARAAARARLEAAGAPVRRDEYWRYTDPARLTAPLAPAPAAEAPPPAADPAGTDAAAAVFVNGRLRADLSDLAPGGAEVGPLGAALRAPEGFARGLFGALEAAGQEKVARPLAALNTVLATEGLAIRVTGAASRPLALRQIQVGDGATLLRHVVRIEPGASLTLLETGVATNTVTEVEVGAGGSFRHVRLQTGARPAAATHLFARVAAGGVFRSFTLTADGALTRNEVAFDLAGDDAVGHAAGAVLGAGEAHVDNTVFVTHSGQRGESRQVYKTVLDGRARSVFQGKIFVRPGAQKTDGYQISQAILLSGTAEFDAKPELEIHADDVKCSHGSTTGALDETALFYLRSRGLPRREAEAMLVAAFVDEAIAEIDDARLAEAVRREVAAWMARR